MSIHNLSLKQLVSLAKQKAAQEKAISAELLEILCMIERKRSYLELDYGSLYDFVEQELGYTGGTASRWVNAVRAAVQVPQVVKKVREGGISMGSAAKLNQYFKQEKYEGEGELTKEEKQKALQAITGKSEREAVQTLVDQSTAPEPFKTKSSAQMLKSGEVEITFRVDAELAAKIEQAKKLLSHVDPSMDTKNLVEHLVNDLIKKKTKVVRNTPAPAQNKTKESRTPSPGLRKRVLERDGHKCVRCGSDYQLEVDHIVAWAAGGRTELDNLQTLCRRHNAAKGAGPPKPKAA